MCLAVPGKIVNIDSSSELPTAEVDFGGVKKQIHLAYTPEAKVDDYVLVHVGFAIKILKPEKAQFILAQYKEHNESP